MRLAPYRQHLKSDRLADVDGSVQAALDVLLREAPRGGAIAVACGSRAIADLSLVVSAVVRRLQSDGYRPFLVPAMGSHGGATAAGQQALLQTLGVDAERWGVPVRASMEVERVGEIPPDIPVYFDRHALAADGILVVNRVKPHTTLEAPLGSGLKKMIAVGLGKQRGADALHRAGLQRNLRPAAALLLERTPVLGGIAIVENACGQTAWLEGVPRSVLLDRDDELLERAWTYLPRLPILPLDLLVVRQMGKNISGTGMDPNVIGRHRRRGGKAEVEIKTIVALRLTPQSHGNATGVGMADLVTESLKAAIDWQATSMNCLTGRFAQGMKLPFAFPDDRAVIEAALALSTAADPPRWMLIQDTAHLEEVYLSESLAAEAQAVEGLEPLGPPAELVFTPEGELRLPLVGAAAGTGGDP